MNTKLVRQTGYGNIIEKFNNHADILYPYANFEIISNNVNNYSNNYSIRLYVMDRNTDEYLSFNKADLIINHLLKNTQLDIANYTYTFFDFDYKDNVHGAFCDFVLDTEFVLEQKCDNNANYIVTEYGDFIVAENNNNIVVE